MLAHILQSFQECRRGAIKIIFVLALPLIVGLFALAVEVSNLNAANRALQEALDSATLAAARALVNTDAERSAIAREFIEQNISPRFAPYFKSVSITSREADDVVQGRADMDFPMFTPAIVGRESLMIEKITEVKSSPDGKLELALVLDTTDSMSVGGRMATLKVAAKDLVEEIMDGSQVKVAVVPFATYVNVGISNRNEKGLDIPADIPPVKNCVWKDKWGPTNCKEVKKKCPINECKKVTKQCPNVVCKKVDATCYKDGAPYSCKKNVCETKGTKPCTETECKKVGEKDCTKKECEWKKTGEKYKDCKTTPAREWKGCVGSRKHPLNTQDKTPAQKIPGYLENESDGKGKIRCNSEIQRLTTNLGVVKSTINTLSTRDDTYIAPGLLWGWRAISHRHPFADGTDPATDDGIRKAIVLMSDGMNTRVMDSGGGKHGGTNANTSNTYLKQVCDNVKDDDIDIYTVAFQITDATIKTLMEECASNPTMYFDAANSGQLKDAFSQIAKDLKVIHISK
jgi:Flp pilus assembly protein TadG